MYPFAPETLQTPCIANCLAELPQVLTTDTWFLVVGYPITSVYVNTLLCNLNARDHIRNVDTEPDSYELQTPVSPQFVVRDVGSGLQNPQVMSSYLCSTNYTDVRKNYRQSIIHIAPVPHVSVGERKVHKDFSHSSTNVSLSPTPERLTLSHLLLGYYRASIRWWYSNDKLVERHDAVYYGIWWSQLLRDIYA